MHLAHFLLVVATLFVTNGSLLSVATPSDESKTKRIQGPIDQGNKAYQQTSLRSLETNDPSEANADEEERFSLGSVKKFFTGEASVFKKVSPEAKQAAAKAKALQQQAKIEKLLMNDDYILKVVNKAIAKEDNAAALMNSWSMYPQLIPVLDKMAQSDVYMTKVLNVWKRGGVSEKKLFNVLDIAKSKSHTKIYHRYADLIKYS